MRLSPLRHAAIGLLTLAIMAGLSVAGWFVFPRTPPKPEAFLPAEHVVALWRNVDAPTAGVLREWFIPLRSLPLPEQGATVAAIRLQSGGIGWVALMPTLQGQSPFTVTASSPDLTQIVRQQNRSLLQDPQYGRMLGQSEQDDRWAYVNLPALSAEDRRLPLPWLTVDSPVALALTEDHTRIILPVQTDLPGRWLPDAPPAAFDAPSLVIQATNPWTIASRGHGAITESARLVLQALVQQSIRTTFGPDIGWHDDMRMIFGKDISYQRSADGRQVLSVRGLTDRDALVTRLHDSVRGTLAASRRDSRTFDRDFAIDSLERDESAQRTTQRTLEGWTIRKTGTGADALVTAERGDELVASRSERAVETYITNPASAPLPTDVAEPVLRGTVSRSYLQSLPSLIPTLWPAALPLPFPDTETLPWSLHTDDGMLVITAGTPRPSAPAAE